MSIEHYENFPVASVLCPAEFRPAIRAIYAFARTADDLADEGDATAAARQAALRAYREDLRAMAAGGQVSARWKSVFDPLALAFRRYRLPLPPLLDLLAAFEEDTRHTGYDDRAGLLDYCTRSANPVGRLLLHLHGIDDAVALRRSDSICTALQLINFWQDLSVDLPRGRVYLPRADLARHGLDLPQLAAAQAGRGPIPTSARALVCELTGWARALMRDGAPLALALPGRVGWELRLVVQGGLRILEKIDAMNPDCFVRRPRIARRDAPRLAWRALRMRAGAPSPRRLAGPA